jgi:ectoine hydroxylase-related dioxygenase (phytanoyl-CoA dioxygenase family)
MSYEFEKYITSKDNVLETIEKYGVAIIPNVLSQEENQAMIDGMWDTLEFLTANFQHPIKRNEPKSFSSIRLLRPLHSMLFQHWSIGHAQFIWDLRQNQKIVDIFSKIWKVNAEELLVSFDGASFQMPPEITKFGWYENTDWLHTDQSYVRNNFECVQSWVTGFEVNEDDGTLTILEGSNKYHFEFAQKFSIKNNRDWYKLNEEELNFYMNDKKCTKKFIRCPAGSIVLWDSRTIHCGKQASPQRAQANYRCVVYISMMPRYVIDYNELKKKRDAFNGLRMTSHWSNRTNIFPLYPRGWTEDPKNPVKQLQAPVLTSLGRKLAGF